MLCSYCAKEVPLVLILQEDAPPGSVGPRTRLACFPCVSDIGQQVMTEFHKVKALAAGSLPDVTPKSTDCVPCSGCGGMRRENCKDYGKHHHDWCDCQ